MDSGREFLSGSSLSVGGRGSISSAFALGSPYSELAGFYDSMFAAWGKDYAAEADEIHELIQRYKSTDGTKLLDLGCGTGEHLRYLQRHYEVAGLDATEEMLRIARTKLPDAVLMHQDMVNSQMDGQFDVILSLFSAISYVKTVPRLRRVLHSVNQHLKPGGITIIEPWYTPEEFEDHRFDAKYGELDSFGACRMRESVIDGTIAKIVDHTLIASEQQVRYIPSHHEFGLFTIEELSSAIADVGLKPYYIHDGLTGIGLHIGVKPCHCEVCHDA